MNTLFLFLHKKGDLSTLKKVFVRANDPVPLKASAETFGFNTSALIIVECAGSKFSFDLSAAPWSLSKIRRLLGATAGKEENPLILSGLQGGQDTSEEFCRQLVQPQLDQPPPLNQLADHLLRRLPRKLPLSARAFAKLSATAAQHFYVPSNRADVEGLCSLATYVIDFEPKDLSQEPFVADAVNHCVLDPLLGLEKLLGSQARIGLKASRDRGAGQTGTSLDSASGQPLGPDGMLFGPDGRKLLIEWEEEDSIVGVSVAASELGSKTALWTRLYYGSLEYHLCFAAGGSSLHFHVVERGSLGKAVAVGSLYNLTDASDRAMLVVTVFNLHALLAAIARSLPASVPPVGEEQITENSVANHKRKLECMSSL